MIVGIVGKQGSGKNWVAEKIVEELYRRHPNTEVETYAFADSLKGIVLSLWKVRSTFQRDKLQEVLVKTKEGYKYKSVRDLLQETGEAIRSIDLDAWTKYLAEKIDDEGYDISVITDVRYQNEADICDVLIRVERTNSSSGLQETQKQHSSETEQDTIPVDITINNDNDNETPWMESVMEIILGEKGENDTNKELKNCTIT